MILCLQQKTPTFICYHDQSLPLSSHKKFIQSASHLHIGFGHFFRYLVPSFVFLSGSVYPG